MSLQKVWVMEIHSISYHNVFIDDIKRKKVTRENEDWERERKSNLWLLQVEWHSCECDILDISWQGEEVSFSLIIDIAFYLFIYDLNVIFHPNMWMYSCFFLERNGGRRGKPMIRSLLAVITVLIWVVEHYTLLSNNGGNDMRLQ